MTREEILAMPAGRELDALVAEKVMGTELQWDEEERQSYRLADSPFGEILNPFNPSTDISAAWEVVEKMRDKLIIFPYEDHFMVRVNINARIINIRSETAPEAICKAALLAVMEGQSHDL